MGIGKMGVAEMGVGKMGVPRRLYGKKFRLTATMFGIFLFEIKIFSPYQ